MSDVVMGPRELMAAADRLTGCRPGMAHEEIRAALISSTPERMWVCYLLDEYKQTSDSAERAALVERMVGHAGENAALRALIKQELAQRVSSTSLRVVGRPKRHASAAVRKREWARAARARRKVGG